MLTGGTDRGLPHSFGRIAFKKRDRVIVAISGGSDSMALLVLFKNWLSEHHPNVAICAVTVDHGLRRESAAEAASVAAFCRRIGVSHVTRKWGSEKPASGVAAAAREARYRLLADTARREGSDLVLTGHTADDQAETVSMRLSRGEGPGIAGMSDATLYEEEVWIVRPLLSVRREQLRSFLAQEGISWIDDPGNDDPAQERVRTRRKLAEKAGEVNRLLTASLQAAFERRETKGAAARLVSSGARQVSPGLVALGPEFAKGDDVSIEAMRALLACCGGTPMLPGRSDTVQLLKRLSARRSGLARTMVTCRKDCLYLHRELRDRSMRYSGGILDFRFRLSPEAVRTGWTLRQRESNEIEIVNPGIPRQLVEAGLRMEAETVPPKGLKPGVEMPRPEIKRYLAPYDKFLPAFDMPLANAVARVFSRQPYKDRPLDEVQAEVF